ncbi:MAG: DUF3192 domain-containing protein [Candidatus Omnitrophota bacterium]
MSTEIIRRFLSPRHTRALFLAVVVFAVFLLPACETSRKEITLQDVREWNRKNIRNISLGMSKSFVLEVMEEWDMPVADSFQYKSISNPFRVEMITGPARQSWEVLYYYVEDKNKDGLITDDELVPFVFENDQLIGWGGDFLEGPKGDVK